MNVFIVEDAPKTRKELADLLADEKGFAVVGKAGSVREAPILYFGPNSTFLIATTTAPKVQNG